MIGRLEELIFEDPASYVEQQQKRIAASLKLRHYKDFSLPLDQAEVLDAMIERNYVGAGVLGVEALYLIGLRNQLTQPNPIETFGWNHYEQWEKEFSEASKGYNITGHSLHRLPKLSRWIVRASVLIKEGTDLGIFVAGTEHSSDLERQCYEVIQDNVPTASLEGVPPPHFHFKDMDSFKDGKHAGGYQYQKQPSLEEVFRYAREIARGNKKAFLEEGIGSGKLEFHPAYSVR